MRIKFTDFKSEFKYFKKDFYDSLTKVGNSGEYVFGNELLKKHLSVIVFNYYSLIKYSKLKTSYFEKIESIELLRALENGFKMGSNQVKSNSFSIDIKDDLKKAKIFFKKDKIKYFYNH